MTIAKDIICCKEFLLKLINVACLEKIVITCARDWKNCTKKFDFCVCTKTRNFQKKENIFHMNNIKLLLLSYLS